MSKGIYNRTYFKNNPEERDLPGILYCVVLVNSKTLERECIKIGITKGTSNKDVLVRAKGFSGYEVRVQKIVKGRLEDIYYLEEYLHELWAHKRYTESHKFGGWTELFQMDMDIIASIPSTV